MSEELKPCICGAEADHIGDTGFVWCQNPHCQLHIRNEFTAGWWNTRPIEDDLRAELARLKEENRRLNKERLIKDNLLLRLKEARPGGTYFQKWGREIEAVLQPVEGGSA